MIQYLVILLDDTSTAYCHADNPLEKRNLIPMETLKRGILFGMKQNLMIQYVFPDSDLPKEYAEIIESIDNVKIYPFGKKPETGICLENDSDVEVADFVPKKANAKNLVIRLPFSEILTKREEVARLFEKDIRLNIVITDIEDFSDDKIATYKDLLAEWNKKLLLQYKQGKSPQFNLLTDRMVLDKMHNCDAGVTNITLAPNGKFYLCPIFYYNEMNGVSNLMNHINPSSDWSVGDLEKGLDVPNQQLLQLDYAPLCRNCDAYQCRRCIWMNRKLTWDCNTPSHQQCVVAHIERNASRELLEDIRKAGDFMPEINIPEINYLDPFDVRKEF